MIRSGKDAGGPTTLREILAAGGMAGGLFLIYALGACRTIYVGDSGELVTAVHLLGIPHPSGYPLYVLLGKAWTVILPIGSIAFRMSLFSAACASAACAGLFLLLRRMGVGAVASVFSALMLAFGPSFWAEANIQRTYALNALMIVLALAAAWRWQAGRSSRALYLAFFVCGLGASNHTFMIVFAICLAVFAVSSEPSLVRRLRPVALSALSFAAGLAPYLYLPLRSRAQPPLDWGNPETLGGFLDVVLRRGFWKRAWIDGPGDAIVIVWDYVAGLGSELAWAGAALSIVGLATMPRRFALLPPLAMIGNLAAVALHGSRADIFIWHRYYIPSYVMAAFLAGHGCHTLSRVLPRRLRMAVLAIPAVLLATGWRAADRSRYTIAEEYSRHVLDSLPPGAHLAATDDNVLFVLMYLHLVEGLRPDVNLIMQGVDDADLPPLRFDPDTEDLYFTDHPNWRTPGLEIVTAGVVFRATRSGRPAPSLPALPARLEGELDDRVPKDYLTSNLIGQYHYMLGITWERRDWPRAHREFRTAEEAAPDNEVLFYNLGLIYSRNGLLDIAEEALLRSQEINPRTGPPAVDKLEEVSRERAGLERLEEILDNDPRFASMEPSSSEYHLLMADLLEQNGEALWARGHRLRALMGSH